jgi:haloacetate dehalogenase
MWRFITPAMVENYTVVITDLRGYGDSSKPEGLDDHSNYSKRAMADDQVEVMRQLGFEKFHVAGHDRGARVLHRMIIDHPDKVLSCTLMDIVSTYDMYNEANREFATKYWHWFFYIQGKGFPETCLLADPDRFINYNLNLKIGPAARANFPPDVLEEYTRCFNQWGTVHGICEDYRASATIDMVLDEPDRAKKITTPLLLLWGADGVVGKLWDVVEKWEPLAENIEGHKIAQCGHFVPEEQPKVVLDYMIPFIEKYSI